MQKYILALLVIFSAFFTTKIGLSPIYITFLTGVYLFLIITFVRKKIYVNHLSLFVVLLIVSYFIAIQILPVHRINSGWIGIVFSLVYFIMVTCALHNVEKQHVFNISRVFVNFSIILLSVEAAWRIANPQLPHMTDFEFYMAHMDQSFFEMSFYVYKFGSFMFRDSNSVGLVVISLFFFSYYLMRFHKQKYSIQLILLFILCLLTLSRAAIVALIFSYLLFSILSKANRYIKPFFIIITAISAIVILFVILEDATLLSKFYIFNQSVQFLKTANILEILFGVGIEKSRNALGIPAHNFIITYLIETGILGLFFISVFLALILYQSKYNAIYVMFPFLLTSMSATNLSTPYLYTIFAIIIFLERQYNVLAKENINMENYVDNKT